MIAWLRRIWARPAENRAAWFLIDREGNRTLIGWRRLAGAVVIALVVGGCTARQTQCRWPDPPQSVGEGPY